ncbi:MAG: 50S ribosomal protein L14e [Nanoarchaeota archaeon]
MLDIGRVCVKTAGKDAGKMVVIVDTGDNKFVTIDGQVKRKRCNILHLEPTSKMLKLKKNAPHAEVVKEFKSLKIEIVEPKTKKQKGPKPQHVRNIKKAAPEKPKEAKKETKKEKKKSEKPSRK